MRVRIPVACGERKRWYTAALGSNSDDQNAEYGLSVIGRDARIVWVEAEIPDEMFQPLTVQGQVAEEATDE